MVGVTCTYNNDTGGAFQPGFVNTFSSSYYQISHPRGRGSKAYHDDDASYGNWLGKIFKSFCFQPGFTAICTSSYYQIFHPRGRGSKAYHSDDASYENWLGKIFKVGVNPGISRMEMSQRIHFSEFLG